MTRTLEDIVGLTIASDLTPSQAQLVWDAITENEPGVERCAQRVMANPNTRRPAPTLLSAIKRRQHLARPASERNSATRMTTLDKAERLYHAKIAHLNEHGALGNGWTQEDAIAYAIDYTEGANDITEAALRERLGVPPHRSVQAPPEALAAIRKLLP